MTQPLIIPPIPKNLLDVLDKMYPEKCPDPKWSEREVWVHVGERNVVRKLLHEFQRQTENVVRDTNVLGKTSEGS